MLRLLLLLTVMCGGVGLVGGCDEGTYDPNSNPLGVESNGEPDDTSSDLPDMPTMSDVDQQEGDQQSNAD